MALFFFQCTSAQPRKLTDTTTYYLKNSGDLVKNKDSADYTMFILNPDTNIDRSLFQVVQYYKNGVRKLMSGTHEPNAMPRFQGTYMAFFPTGRRKAVMNYDMGRPTGEAIDYYPNGRVYRHQFYEASRSQLIDCFDSTGRVLTENGNGKWVNYNDDFKTGIDSGIVVSQLKEDEWHGMAADSANYVVIYRAGKVVSGKGIDKNGKAYSFTEAEVEPTFKGGIAAFYGFLGHEIHYPNIDRQNGITGKVFIQFIVEKDGTLSHVKTIRGPSVTLSEEALRAIKLSPSWIPAYQLGRPVRIQYTVPVNFTL